tara:strand:+ start:547 stop:1143 length:597 start_codon:yes stop_codon:yes gene_type:complete
MTVIVMKFLSSAVFSISVFFAGMLSADDRRIDFDELATNFGDVYRDVTVLKADRYGILFRHQYGAAKIGYAVLPKEVAGRYLKGARLASSPAGGATGGFEVSEEALKKWPEMVVTLRTRRTMPVYAAGPFLFGCGYSRAFYEPAWPAYWSRYQPAHQFANPFWREMAVQDLLYTSGLTPGSHWSRTYNYGHFRPRLGH